MAVLISIKPKYCELIESGKKTIEVRKTRPKCKTPFKCYIYETKTINKNKLLIDIDGDLPTIYSRGSGKVIGEFVCDKIFPMSIKYSDPNSRLALKEFPYTCLTDKQIIDYLGNGKDGYGWHISNLKVYDKQKELREFHKPCTPECNYSEECGGTNATDCLFGVTRAPQSWMYVQSPHG